MNEVTAGPESVHSRGVRAHISHAVIATYAADALAEVDGVAGLLGGHFGSRDRRTDPERAAKAVHVEVNPGGTVALTVHVLVAYGASIPDVAAAAGAAVRRYLRSMVDVEVEAVTLHVDAVAG
jgi:uncharacterized alkaline shock family protein YloU